MAKSSAGPLLLVGLGLVALAISSTASAAPSKTGAPGGPMPPAPPPPVPPTPTPIPAAPAWTPGTPCAMSANVPANVQTEVQRALVSDLSPADYETLAADCDKSGFADAAACLRAKEQLVLQEIQTRGGMPFIIRQGDIPVGLAQYYTGNPQRFRELEPLNPNIGQLVTVGGASNYQGWIPGTEILIPKAWNPGALPLPFAGGTSL